MKVKQTFQMKSLRIAVLGLPKARDEHLGSVRPKGYMRKL